MRMGSLYVEFLDDTYEVVDGESFTFGRDARLVVDSENRHLHRVLGAFTQYSELWVLHNVGRHLPMVVTDAQSRTELNPGGFLSLLSEHFTISFEAGGARYEIEGRVPGVVAPRGFDGLVGDPDEPDTFVIDTVEVAIPELNEEQRMLVAAMAEPLLRGGSDWPASMPTNQEVAERLGWSGYKLNRKLDYLCSRIAQQGIDGLAGDSGRRATQRRVRLVEYMVGRRVITLADLDGLPTPSGTGGRRSDD